MQCCQANAAQSAIELDESFFSGDDAPQGHPRCRCAVLSVFKDDVDKAYDAAQPRDSQGRWISVVGRAIATALARSSGVVRASLGPIRKSSMIHAITGIDVRGFKHSVTNQSINHTLRKHGSIHGEKRRGQIAVDASDFLNLSFITRAPDSIHSVVGTGKNGEPRLVFEKSILGIRYFYVAQTQAGKRRIEMVTMWKK